MSPSESWYTASLLVPNASHSFLLKDVTVSFCGSNVSTLVLLTHFTQIEEEEAEEAEEEEEEEDAGDFEEEIEEDVEEEAR